ncbi:uncharacterized protein LOC129608533 [Condylostylus longicornis]|uniref:uncharacterized protein LOC129608533 n=1 Tax=Condylostylus longicornis TaxID=2530218 RepID=UPI00244DBB0D|nr:uncharacterized protein LOC129608533 [Condylostylus longicornis]
MDDISNLIQFESFELVDLPVPKVYKYPVHLYYGHLKNIKTAEIYKNKLCCKKCFEIKKLKTYRSMNHGVYEHIEKIHQIKIRNKEPPMEKKKDVHSVSPNVSEIWNMPSSVASTLISYEKEMEKNPTTSEIDKILGEGVVAPDSCITSTSSAISPALVPKRNDNTDVDIVPDVDAIQPLGAKEINEENMIEIHEKNNAANGGALRKRLLENGRDFGTIIGRWLGELPKNDQQQLRIFQKIQKVIMDEWN